MPRPCGSPRLVYAVPLARNFRECLLGLAKKPDYYLSAVEADKATTRIAEFWARRCLPIDDKHSLISLASFIHYMLAVRAEGEGTLRDPVILGSCCPIDDYKAFVSSLGAVSQVSAVIAGCQLTHGLGNRPKVLFLGLAMLVVSGRTRGRRHQNEAAPSHNISFAKHRLWRKAVLPPAFA